MIIQIENEPPWDSTVSCNISNIVPCTAFDQATGHAYTIVIVQSSATVSSVVTHPVVLQSKGVAFGVEIDSSK
jgi:hypothetical protein